MLLTPRLAKTATLFGLCTVIGCGGSDFTAAGGDGGAAGAGAGMSGSGGAAMGGTGGDPPDGGSAGTAPGGAGGQPTDPVCNVIPTPMDTKWPDNPTAACLQAPDLLWSNDCTCQPDGQDGHVQGTPSTLDPQGDRIYETVTGVKWTRLQEREIGATARTMCPVIGQHPDYKLPTVAEIVTLIDYGAPWGARFSPQFTSPPAVAGETVWARSNSNAGAPLVVVNVQTGEIAPQQASLTHNILCRFEGIELKFESTETTIRAPAWELTFDLVPDQTWEDALAVCGNGRHLASVRELAVFAEGVGDPADFAAPLTNIWSSTPARPGEVFVFDGALRSVMAVPPSNDTRTAVCVTPG